MSEDTDLRDSAVEHLHKTTVSYPQWKKNVAAGKYKPPDGSTTEWGMAFHDLEQIGMMPVPPPSTKLGAGIGTGRPGNSYGTSSQSDLAHFDMLMTDLNAVSAPRDLPQTFHYFYRSLCTSAGYDSSIPRQVVQNNGWYLKDSAGNPVNNAGYGGWALDLSNKDMSNAWAQNAIKWAQENGYQGIFGDDYDLAMRSFVSTTPDGWSQDYWLAMLRQHTGIIAQALKAAGIAFAVNCASWGIGHPADQDGSADRAEYKILADLGCSGVYKEYWLQWGDGSNTLYTGGDWDNWRSIHQTANEVGLDFIGVTYGDPDSNQNLYGRATHLLDRERPGSIQTPGVQSTMPPPPGYQSFGSLWCRHMGAPLGPAVQSDSIWSRKFENGSVTVNKDQGTASIS